MSRVLEQERARQFLDHTLGSMTLEKNYDQGPEDIPVMEIAMGLKSSGQIQHAVDQMEVNNSPGLNRSMNVARIIGQQFEVLRL
jgi:hypothetical protein